MENLYTPRTALLRRARAGTPHRLMGRAVLWLLTSLLGYAAHAQTVPVTSGLRLYLKADAGITSSGGTVSAWADQSGNGFDVAQATATARPTLVASSAINGRPALRFNTNGDGTTDFLTNTTATLSTNGSPNTVFAVARTTAASDGGVLFTSRRTNPMLSYQLGFGSGAFYIYSDGVNAGNNATTADQRTALRAPFISTFYSTGPGSLLGLRLNGTALAVSQPAGMATETGAAGFIVGTRADIPSSAPWTGDYAEVLVYNRALTAAEIMQVETYLSNKYGIATPANLTPSPAPVTGGLRLHLAADLGVTSSGGTVSAWADQSGNSFDVAQPTAGLQPALAANAVNGKPALALDGTNDRLPSAAGVDLLGGQTSYTFFAVAKPGTTQQAYANIFDYNHSGGVRFVVQQDNTTTNSFYNNAANSTNQTLPTTAFSIYGGTYVNGGTATSRLDGGNPLSGAATTNSFGTPSPFTVGAWTTGGREFNGQLAEILVYDRVLTPAEIGQVESYLGTKYAITLASAAPTISSFTPATGAAGTTVTITGTKLDQLTSVQIGGATATSVAVVGGSGNTQLTAVVGTGAQTGRVVLNYSGGMAISSTDFVVPLPNIARAEYFLDTDPGFGAATAFTLGTASADMSGLSASISLSSLSAGFHLLGVRSRDAAGKWSLTSRRTFYYEPAASGTLADITRIEYFLDADPGFGAGTDVLATAGADVSGLAFVVPLGSLSAGFHTLSVRSRDAAGKWSLTSVRNFYYEPAASATLADITKVEYFLDADPGFGLATDVPVAAMADVSGAGFVVPLASVSAGFHTLQVRSRDAAGKWSLTSVRNFYYEPLLAAATNINKLEYYFDTDPGFGSATDVPVPTPAPDLAGFAFVADASGLADGAHRIFFRSRDADGKWSLVSSRSFVKNGCASSANFAASLPGTSYSTLGNTNGLAETAFNTDPAAPTTSNTFYGLNGGYLIADLGSTQTMSDFRYKVTPSVSGTYSVQVTVAASAAGPFTSIDTYSGSLVANVTTTVARTLTTPASARILRLRVITPGGSYLMVSGAGAYYFNCAGPTITSFTPAGGAGGTVLTLTGTNLSGATAVTFNGVAAVVSTISNNTGTSLTVTAPAGGTTGPICVTTPAGTVCSAASYVYPPTIATGTVTPAAFCSTTLIQVPFTTPTAGYGAGNTFSFQLSDANGVFTAGSRLYGNLLSSNTNGGVLRDSIALRTPAGSGYRVRVVASNPATTGTDNGTNLTIYPMPAATATANSPVAFGGTIQLVAQPTGQTGMGSYAWYAQYTSGGGIAYVGSGQTLNLPNAQPNQSGKYFVYVANANDCRDSASVRVLVQPNAVPVLAMSQFSYSGCAGVSLNIGFAVTGNSFAAGNAITAQLSSASGSFAAPTTIGTVNFTGQGNGAVSATIPANTPTGSGYRIRLVGSNPAVVSGTDNGANLSLTTQPTAVPSSNSPVAFGGSIQLAAQAVAGASYQWVGPGFSSTQQNPTIPNATAGNSGSYTLYVTVGGCQSPGVATSVTVSPSAQPILAIAQFGGSFCPGSVLNISFSVTGNSFAAGNTITAQLSDASGSFAAPVSFGQQLAFAGQGSGSVSGQIPLSTVPGTGYRIRLIGTNPAVTSTTDNGTNLTVNAPPVATASSNSPIVSGGTLQLNAGPSGASSYQWYVSYTTGGGGFLSNQQNPTFNNRTPSSSGFYYVFVTQGGCTDSASVRVLVNPPSTTTLALGAFSGQFCAGSNYAVNYSVSGAGLSNGTITAQLSDASGSFAAPVVLASVSFNGTGSSSLGFTMPAGTVAGAAYRIRLVSTNPGLTSADNGTNLTVTNLTNVVAGSNSPVASGALIQFSSSGVPAGASIGWTGPNSFSSSLANPSIPNANAANAGTYTLVVTQNGCAVTRTVQVTVGAASLVLATGPVSGSFCPGGAIVVPYSVTTGSVNGGNTFSVQLSNASGSFASPATIGSLSSSAANGTITAQIPVGTVAGSGYRVRVVANSPAAVGSDNGTDLTVGALTYTWTGGNGNTSWFDPLNWSCGQVPNATSVVTIPGGVSFYPIITGTTAAALNLTVQTGATFTVNTTFSLYGNVTVLGTVTALPTSSWYFAGSGSQYQYGSSPLQVGTVYINSGVNFYQQGVLNVYGSWYNYGSYVGGAGYNVYFNGPGGLQYIGGTAVTTFYNAYVNSGAVVNLGINTVFLNNFVVNGTFGAASYGVVFGGTAGQTIGGTGTSTYYNVTINNLVGLTLVSDITVLGNWINNGVFIGGSYSVVFAGTVAQLIGGTAVTNFYNLTLSNAVSVTLNQNIYVLGGFANTGVFYGYQVLGGVTTGYFVRFGGTGAQVINANATTYFYHFYVDNVGGVSLATNIYIAGNYYLYGGSFAPGLFTVFFNGTGGYVQTVGGYQNLSFYGWNIGSGSFVRLIQNVTWLGNFVNAGTFYGYNLVGGVYTGYTSVFGGSVAQVISGTGVYEFWHVTWNNLVGITLNQNVSVWGNWLNNGGYFANGYLVNFIGNVAQLIGGSVNTVFHHVTITNLVSVSLNQAITVLGNWAGSGVFLGNGYLTYFNGTAAQTIFCGLNTRFFDLRFNNPVSVTLLSNIYLLGNWTHDGGFFANGYTVFFGGSVTQFIAGTTQTIFHHVNIVSGATVQINRNITLLGNWLNNGSFLPNGLLVYFNGTLAQLIGGTSVTNFFGLTMNNPVSVTLNQNIYVLGGFVNSGIFYGYQGTTGYFVRFGGTTAQVINANATTYFYHFYADNAAGVSLTSNVYIAGNYYLYSGFFTPGTYTVFFNGTGGYVQTVGGYQNLSFYGWNIGSAASVRLLQNVTLLGNFANAGTFYGYNLVGGVYTGYTCAFGGTVAQSLTGAGVYDFWHLTWNNLAGVTLNQNISLRGNWLHYGGFVANGYLVTFGGSALQFVGGTVATLFHHFTIATGATVRQDLGITLLGDWTNNGLFNPNGLLTYFNGTVGQTIAGTALTTFYDVTFNNAVNVSLGQHIDVTHHFVNSGGFCGCGFRTRFNGTAAQTITCTSGRTHFHDLTFANLTGVTLLDGIYVSGLWVNNGGYLANNQTVIFDGTVGQTIGGSVLTAFYNLGITNAVDVQLLRDITVAGFWNNTGIFHGNGFGVTFNGLLAQVITTTGTLARTYFHHVTWANLTGCTLGGDVYVAGNWLCNAPFNPATWTVYFNGTLAQTCGGSQQLRFFGLNCSNPAGVTYNGPVYLLGNFVNTGLVNCGLYGWYCTGTAPQTIGGISTTPTRFYDLYIQNATGVTATDNWFVTHVLTPTTGNLASNGHLTLTSNATGTAMVVNPVGGGVVTGVATMERFITGLSGAPGYRHYSSPMQLSANGISTTVQEFADDLPVFELNPAYNTVGNAATPFPTLFEYDEARLTSTRPTFDDGFRVPTATDDLLPLRGYTAQTDPTTTVDIAGLLQNGPVSLSLSRGPLANAGWHLLGNPYPAPMDWDVARTQPGALVGVADALYVFQPTGRYTGSYKSYVNGLGQNGGGKDLAAMQGFFVRATAAPASVSLTNAVRATSYVSPGFSRPAPVAGQPLAGTPRPVLRLEVRNVATAPALALADETVLYFEQAAGLGFSPAHDAYKVQLNGDGRPSLWSEAGPASLAINGLPDLATAPVVPLGVRVSRDGAHRLVLTALAAAPAGTQVWLEDRLLNRRQNLAQDSTYAFTMKVTDAAPRFFLNFRAASPLAVTTGKLEARTALYPNPTTGTATLALSGLREQSPVRIEVLNVLGQPVQQRTARPRLGELRELLDLSALPTGVYSVRIHAQEGTVVKRLVKE